jgi:hypothetical protein
MAGLYFDEVCVGQVFEHHGTNLRREMVVTCLRAAFMKRKPT